MPAIKTPVAFIIPLYNVLERRETPFNATVVEGAQSSGNGVQGSTIVGIVVALVCFIIILLAFRFVPKSECLGKKRTPQQKGGEKFLQRWMTRTRLFYPHTSASDHHHPSRQSTISSEYSTVSRNASIKEMEFTYRMPILSIRSTCRPSSQSNSNSPQDMVTLENSILKPPPAYTR